MAEVAEVSSGDPTACLEGETQDSDVLSSDCSSVDKGSSVHRVGGACRKALIRAQLDRLLAQGGAKQDALNILRKLFGKNLLDRVIQQKGFSRLPEYISRVDVLLLIEEIGNVFTFDDLEQVFVEIKAGDTTTREILQFMQAPLFCAWWARSIRDIPNYWINQVLELFKTPLNKIGSYYDCGESYSSNSTISQFNRIVRELQKRWDSSFHAFSMSHKEPLARLLAYIDPATTPIGVLVPILNERTGKLDYYKLSHQICHKGLKCFLFTPIKPSDDRPAQLIFSGTNLKELSSIRRDFDLTGVGKSTFTECAPQIKAMVQKKSCATIDILGFSLGASDAQRAMIELVTPATSYTDSTHPSRIRLFAFCSPKLDKESIERWRQKLSSYDLSDQRHRPHIELNFAQHENDIITQVGGGGHLSGTSKFYIPTHYLVVHSDSRFMKKGDHTTAFFDRGKFDHSVDNRTYQIYESIDKELLEQKYHQVVELQRQLDAWYGSIYFMYTTFMSCLFHVTTLGNLQQEIKELQSKKEKFQEWCARTTWPTVTLLQTLNQAIKFAVDLIAFGVANRDPKHKPLVVDPVPISL